MNAFAVDCIGSCADFLGRVISPPEPSFDKLLAVLIQQVKRVQVRACRNLNELCKPITDLRDGEGAQKREVKKRVDRCVVGTEPVLVVPVVDSNFDRHGSIDQTDHGGGHPNEVGVPAIRGAGKPSWIARQQEPWACNNP